jgi:predicted nucleic acid-binding protein
VLDLRTQIGVLDTSVVIDLTRIQRELLPNEFAVSAITMAELAAGPHATLDFEERARRQDLLQRVEASLDPLPFDTEAARAFGRLYVNVFQQGKKARGSRALDLMIAATAMSHRMPLYTRNPQDFVAISEIVEIIAV